MINPGGVAAIRVVGVRGDPCGAMCWTVKDIYIYIYIYRPVTMCNIQANCAGFYVCYPTLNKKENEFDCFLIPCVLCGKSFFFF